MDMKFEAKRSDLPLMTLTKNTESKYEIPRHIVNKYLQVLIDHSINQKKLPLKEIVEILSTESIPQDFIPHHTWLLIKTRHGDVFQAELAMKLLKEYLQMIQ